LSSGLLIFVIVCILLQSTNKNKTKFLCVTILRGVMMSGSYLVLYLVGVVNISKFDTLFIDELIN